MHPHTSYLIMATPRCGSYLLCEALIRTRLAGHPTEYFGPVQTKAIMQHLDTSNYAKCLDWILAEGTTPNGVFGGKVIWKFQAEFVDRIRKVVGYEKQSMPEMLSTAFPDLHYIWMTRRDKVRQAISYWKALKTNTWIDFGDRQSSEPVISNQQEPPRIVPQESNPLQPPLMQEATFDYAAIEDLRHYLEQSEGEIEQYFATCGIQPFKVVYEDFIDVYQETVLQILAYLHIPAPEKLAFAGERTLKKQADEQSEQWLQRYYQLKQREEADRQAIDIMQENAAQRYIRANVVPPDPSEANWKDKPLPFKLYRNCEQIPLGQASPTIPIGQILLDIYGITRQAHSISTFHPMLKYLPAEETQVKPFYTALLRPVPSGGGLFPCELYLLVGPSQHLLAGIYHYDVAHHALDILKQGNCTSILQSDLAHPGETTPAYTLLLSSYFWKDGFKYGAFSYRLQGLDIGTIISQSEIMARHSGFATTIHYQFQDKALNDLLGLDPLHESVYAVIEWRQGENQAALLGAEEVDLQESGEEVRKAGASALGTINASALETNEISSRFTTESIACWTLPEEIHRASLIETREAFRPLHSLAHIQLPGRGEETLIGQLASPMFETLPLSADTPLDLWEARTQRRSATGTFLPTPLTKLQLSQLLLTSMYGTINDLDGHTDFLQHTMLYCVVYRVQGVPAGVYRYQPEKHELELVRAGIQPYELYQTLSMTDFNLFYTSVSFFPVGNYKRGFQVYGDRWYRMQNMEAGIIAQRLYLAAAALSLGCRASLSFPVPETNRFLGLSDAKDAQYTSLMQLMIAPERSAYQHYEQSLLI